MCGFGKKIPNFESNKALIFVVVIYIQSGLGLIHILNRVV